MDLEHFRDTGILKVILSSSLSLSADLSLPSFITEPLAVQKTAEQV